jgi:TonB-dependent receptor
MSNHVSRFVLASLIGAGFVSSGQAQLITGVVTDSSGEVPIEGAIVTVEGLNRSTSTNRFGEYRISNIPAGNYSVTADYVGTERKTQTIDVAETGATLNFMIGDDVTFLDNILVVGSAAASAGAINQQRASDSILSVVDSDGLGNFPDTTVADTLARVPGLSIETDQGEGRYVSIRGINTDLISASINGVRTPSPEDRRGVLLDGVPSDLLDGIEVQKSLTPDLDADTLGGTINLKTISAFDRKGQFFRAKLEGQQNDITETWSPKGTITYTNRITDRLGVALSLNYQDLRIEAHNNETGGWDQFDGADFLLPAIGQSVFAPSDDYEQRWYDLTRERLGLVANFDWKVGEDSQLYLRTLLNRYVDDEVRNKFEFREMDEEIVSATGSSVSYRRGEVDAEVRLREEIRNIQTFSLGGVTEPGEWIFDYEVSYAFAEEDDSNNHDVNFRSSPEQRNNTIGAITFDYTNPQQPVISGPALNFLLNPANYQLDTFEREFTTNEDRETAIKFNVAKEVLLGSVPVEWKFGVKYRNRDKERDQNLEFYEGDFDLVDFIQPDAAISNWRLANPMFRWPDAYLTAGLRDVFTENDLDAEASFLESAVGDFQIDERVFGTYVMGTFDVSRATIVAGVRLERADTDLKGFFVEEGGTASNLLQFKRNNTDVLPSLNVKYGFTDKLIGRAAYYASLVRPAFGEMAPRALLNEDRDVIELGNPNLSDYAADNFDLSLEFYPTELSVFSIGAFHKEIDDAIFPAVFDIADVPNGIDLSFLDATTRAGLAEVVTFINVGKSSVTGVEANYVQALGDLVPALDGFLVSANVTLSDSSAELPDGREVPFLKQSDTIWNLAIGYDKGPWDLRVSANSRGDYLDVLVDENLDRYTDDRLLVEASAKFDISDSLQVYVEGKNLTDEPEYYYHGAENRLSQYDEFGRSVILGVRLTY